MSPNIRLVAACAAALAACAHRDRGPALPPDAPRAAAAEAARRDPQAGPPLGDAEQIEHVLLRATFGPRAADRQRIQRIGIAAWLEEQLHPASIPDQAAQTTLRSHRVLTASSGDLMTELLARQDERRKARQARAAGAESMLESMADAPPEREAMRMGPGGLFVGELANAKVLRAILTERQLEELMVDFWFNHFNVFAGKDRIRALVGSYERDAIRPHALGRFRDLLAATARHPAMLIYLDNWRSSAAPDSAPVVQRVAMRRPFQDTQRLLEPERRRRNRRPRGRGLNENYARELLELHTLGVDGGYTQKDVQEVARCFTGWTLREPRTDPSFTFRRSWHDAGEKLVLGRTIDAGGEGDGDAVLDLLAAHPETARFISRKLVRRFVSDDPPQLLVEQAAEAFQRTQGDIRAVLRTIFASPEFWSRRALRAKVRTPLELVAGAARALSASVDDATGLARAIERIGAPLYMTQPPTGLGDTADAWVSPGALLARINFALALAEGRVPGVRVDLASLAHQDREQVLDRARAALGAAELSAATRAYVLSKLREVPDARREQIAARATGLLLGAPDLQRR